MAGKGQSQPQRLASSTKLWAGSQLLTTSSWDPGWLTSARRVAAWDQLPRGDTRHTWDSALVASWETEQPGLGRWLRHTVHLGPCACQAPGCLSWEGHKMYTPLSLCPMRSAREHECEHLRTGKCTKCRACFGQYHCRATWSLSSVDMESTCTMSWDKPSVAQTLWALPTHTSDICLQCSSLPTAQLNKLA